LLEEHPTIGPGGGHPPPGTLNGLPLTPVTPVKNINIETDILPSLIFSPNCCPK